MLSELSDSAGLNVPLAIILAVFNIPLYWVLYRAFFTDVDELVDAIKFWITPQSSPPFVVSIGMISGLSSNYFYWSSDAPGWFWSSMGGTEATSRVAAACDPKILCAFHDNIISPAFLAVIAGELGP